jgi:hypothetical protein
MTGIRDFLSPPSSAWLPRPWEIQSDRIWGVEEPISSGVRLPAREQQCLKRVGILYQHRTRSIER